AETFQIRREERAAPRPMPSSRLPRADGPLLLADLFALRSLARVVPEQHESGSHPQKLASAAHETPRHADRGRKPQERENAGANALRRSDARRNEEKQVVQEHGERLGRPGRLQSAPVGQAQKQEIRPQQTPAPSEEAPSRRSEEVRAAVHVETPDLLVERPGSLPIVGQPLRALLDSAEPRADGLER